MLIKMQINIEARGNSEDLTISSDLYTFILLVNEKYVHIFFRHMYVCIYILSVYFLCFCVSVTVFFLVRYNIK